jgi:hypothetical protein
MSKLIDRKVFVTITAGNFDTALLRRQQGRRAASELIASRARSQPMQQSACSFAADFAECCRIGGGL